MKKYVLKRWPKAQKAKLYNFIAGIERAGIKLFNFESLQTSLIKLPFLVFQNFILNCVPLKSTLSIPSYRLILFFAPLTR